MSRSPNVTIYIHSAIISGYNDGLSPSALSCQFSLSRQAIYKIIRCKRTNGGFNMKYSRGRPMPTTKYQDRMIVCKSRGDPRLNSFDIHREMSTYYGFKASSNTVQRRLCAAELNRRRLVERPLIYLMKMKARVEIAKRHIRWIANE